MTVTVGVDVGGTKIAAGVVDDDGLILDTERVETPAEDSDAAVRAIVEVAPRLRKAHPNVAAVGVSAAGFVSSDRATMLFTPNLAWRDLPLRDLLEKELQVPVVIENDANAAAWGEFRFGAGSEADHLVFITLGTGVGGGVITEGLLLRGAQGAGGELGHVTIQATGPRCSCGNHGCLEALASGTAIQRRAREVANEQPDSALGQLAIQRKVLGEDVTELANQGDEAAASVLNEAGVWLGVGLAGFVNVFNPEVIAIGGSVAKAGERILEPARQEVYLRARSPSRDLVRIQEATLGTESGVLGAAALARDEAGEYVLGS
jgi:glucokinase